MKHKASDYLSHADILNTFKAVDEMEDIIKKKAKARKKKIKYFKATVRVLVNRLLFWRGK
jgi:hypothetical protein